MSVYFNFVFQDSWGSQDVTVIRRTISGCRSLSILPEAVRVDRDALKRAACPASRFLSPSHQLPHRLLKLF